MSLHFRTGLKLLEQGRYSEAEAALEHFQRAATTVEAMLRLGVAPLGRRSSRAFRADHSEILAGAHGAHSF